MSPRIAAANRRENPVAELLELLRPLIAREVATISALDAAISGEDRPDYVGMLHDMRTAKQANVEQMATVIRMFGQTPPEEAGLRGLLMKVETDVTLRASGTAATLRVLLAAERAQAERYIQALASASGITKDALTRAHGRTTEHRHTLAAHVAKHVGHEDQHDRLPRPLTEYFAGPVAKACMRCHLDRPGARQALERRDPRPYTYVCAGCHDDVLIELMDLAGLMDGWPEAVRQARVIQHALGRGSKLYAARTVLRRLSGLPEERPVAGPKKPLSTPDSPPAPDPDERNVVVSTEAPAGVEGQYVSKLFDYRSVRSCW